jgi:hypothetical protein
LGRATDAFILALAAREDRGLFPRWTLREQSYWTPTCCPGGSLCGILNEEGLFEPGPGTFSVEPFLRLEGKLITWADAAIAQNLEDGCLPIPSVTWFIDGLSLQITAYGGIGKNPELFIRYRLASACNVRGSLFAAIRPLQANPPWQRHGPMGGIGPIHNMRGSGNEAIIDGQWRLRSLDRETRFSTCSLDSVRNIPWINEGSPLVASAEDPDGLASGAFQWDFDLLPGATLDWTLGIGPVSAQDAGFAPLDAVVNHWRASIQAVPFKLAQDLERFRDLLCAATGHILTCVNGSALQPGPRRYTRSWIRDGCVMASALLRVGCAEPAKKFVRWYATYIREDGCVPCCVDATGPDWLVEHDSHGQFLYVLSQCVLFDNDRDLAAELAPIARQVAAHIETLRARRLTSEFDMPAQKPKKGLLPESASHEGYLAHPVHSYWDDFWAVRGLRDLADICKLMDNKPEAARIVRLSADLSASIAASIEAVIRTHNIDYIPGSVEWADFDPTATSMAVCLLNIDDYASDQRVAATFDRYMQNFRDRRDGTVNWNNCSPYEIRITGALARLGRREEAMETLEWFIQNQRPAGWRQWPEILWRGPRAPAHIGDMPHAWIAAEFIHAALILSDPTRTFD